MPESEYFIFKSQIPVLEIEQQNYSLCSLLHVILKCAFQSWEVNFHCTTEQVVRSRSLTFENVGCIIVVHVYMCNYF